jgi:hypothetical protein
MHYSWRAKVTEVKREILSSVINNGSTRMLLLYHYSIYFVHNEKALAAALIWFGISCEQSHMPVTDGDISAKSTTLFISQIGLAVRT